jgi:parallel beta-helix repeat protein
MQKAASAITLLIILLLSTLTATLTFTEAQASTDISGIITSDTTWTKENSPYTLTGPTAVNMETTLTIEPGVIVNLNKYSLQINGTLQAIGTVTDPIYLDNIASPNPGVVFTESSSSWNEQTGSGCIIENSVATIEVQNASPKIQNSKIALNVYGGAPMISNNTFEVNPLRIFGGSPIVLKNFFNVSCIEISGGNPLIQGNNITGDWYQGENRLPADGIIINGTANAQLSNNIIANHREAGVKVIAGNGTIEKNLIENNDKGLIIEHTGSLVVQNNTISKSYHEAIVDASNSSPPKIVFNNLQDNGADGYSKTLNLGSSALEGKYQLYDINATYNWWGTTDVQAVNQSIYDKKNDFNLGEVSFVPFLSSANPQAMPDPNAPIPALLPSPTPTQSLLSSQSPTESSSPTLSPTPSPNVTDSRGISTELFVGVVAVFAAVVVVLAAAVAVLLRRTRKATGS